MTGKWERYTGKWKRYTKKWKRYSKEEERAIMDLHDAGWSNVEIGHLLKRDHCSVEAKRMQLQRRRKEDDFHQEMNDLRPD